MSKKWSESFVVSYRQPGRPRITVLGVTSIVPQRGNLVLNTEDGVQFFISEDQLTCKDCKMLMGMSIEFINEDTIDEVLAAGDEEIVIDHRICSSDWQLCTCGPERLLVNEKKQYTLLENTKAAVSPYCVAFMYDSKSHTWEQGHYFSTYGEALEFMFG